MIKLVSFNIELLNEAISNQLDYPENITSQFLESEVCMKLYVSENSEINIGDLSATNQELGVYV
ncbi:MAG: hypothetical protein JEZ09_09515 [Salinivirgaceae bacterium]|nr:hypothetical protein [Salinivirgaceae bacterium]